MIETLIEELPSIKEYHDPKHPCYKLLERLLKKEIARLFLNDKISPVSFGAFGKIFFPYIKMGDVDSLALFSLDEFLIFSFYWHNKKRYKTVLDAGGNMGLHTILLSHAGYEVTVYEPDPWHFERLKNNLALNSSKATAINKALSSQNGSAPFIRVKGNTLSNHIKGAKKPYGETETIHVETHDIKDIISNFSLIKMDVEGSEKEILLSTNKSHWQKTDAFIEICSRDNARALFDHFKTLNIFSQKTGWQRVTRIEDMPTSHKEGTIFLTSKPKMPWPK